MDRKGRSMKKFKFSILCIVLIVLSVFSFLGFNNVNVSANEENDVVLNIYKNNISYSSEIFILYAVEYENINLDNSEISMLFFEDADKEFIKGNEAYASYSKGIEEVEGKDCLIFYSKGLAAKEMTDYVYSRVYVNIDGVDYYSDINRYSVLEYVYEMKEYKELSEEEIEFFDNMLAYGASAQKIFDYREYRLADDTYYKISVVDAVLDGKFSSALYKLNEIVTISAYEEKDGIPFAYWQDREGNIVSEDRVLEFEVTENINYTAIYKEEPKYVIQFKEELQYYGTLTDIEFPSEIEFVHNEDKINASIEFNTSSFVANKIGTQRIYARVTDEEILNNDEISIQIYMDIEVLPFGIELNEGLYAITDYVGEDKNVVLPSTYKGIDINAISSFNFGLIESIYIPASIKEIGSNVFVNCTTLKEIYYYGTLEEWCDIEYEDKFSNPLNNGGSFHLLNEDDEWYEVTEIVIPSTLTSIKKHAFQGFKNLISVEIPNNITSIGEYAFQECLNLQKVYYGGTIEDWINLEFANPYANPMFYGKEIYIYNEDLEWEAVKEIVIPDGTLDIAAYKFNNFGTVVDLTIPTSLTYIASAAFNMCTSLENVYYKGSILDWMNLAWKGEFANPMRYASNIYMLDENGEWYEPTEITIPDGVSTIGWYEFYNFDQVKDITIPLSVNTIRPAFDGCDSLENIYYNGTIEQWSQITMETESANPLRYASNLYVKDENGEWVKNTKVSFTLDWQGNGKLVQEANQIRTMFLKDFYDWCSEQGAFSDQYVSFETFVGENFDGVWFNYTGAPGNPSNIYSYYDSNAMCNYMFDPSDYDKTATVNSNTQYFFNDPEMNNKWADFMIYLEELFRSDRGWSKMNIYYIYDLGRYMQSFTGANPYIPSSAMTNVPTGYEDYVVYMEYAEQVDVMLQTGSYELPKAVKEGLFYLGWTDGSNIYTRISESDSSINGKTLVPYFVDSYITSSEFENNEFLTNLEIPEGVIGIYDYAFSGCNNLESVKLPSTLQSIGSYVFSNCSSLTSIDIPEGVTSIGVAAFANCTSLTSIEIPEGVICVDNNTFEGCNNLESVKLPSTLQIIGYYVFSNCSSLTDIDIPEGVTSIWEAAFVHCTSLTSIEIPEGVICVDNNTFEGCSNLESVKLPSTLQSVETYAFYNCTSLENVYYQGKLEDWCKIVFDGKESNPTANNAHLYMINDYNQSYELINVSFPSTVSSIGQYAFYNCEFITSIEIPSTITHIGAYAFRGCTGLTSVEIPESITTIERAVFASCYNIESISLPSTLEVIGYSAFASCSSLTDIEIPENVVKIDSYAFNECDNLEKIIIPLKVENINLDAFYGCDKVHIYCEAAEKPSTWSTNWNSTNCPVTWGYTEND